MKSKLFERVRRRIRKLREQRGWTQADLARHTGISAADVCRVEVGSNCNMKLSRLEDFARAFRIKVEELVKA
jgi:ribosome-binding protein aMBF1 (putative translation factor)